MALSTHRRARPAVRRRPLTRQIARFGGLLAAIREAGDPRRAVQTTLDCLATIFDSAMCAAIVREPERDSELIALTSRDPDAAHLLSALQSYARQAPPQTTVQSLPLGGESLPALIVPIFVQQRHVGIIGVAKHAGKQWRADQITVTDQIAGELEHALERLALHEALRSRSDELAAVAETAVAISSQRELAATLQTIVERAARLARAEGGSLYLCDDSARELEVVVSYRLDHDYRGERVAVGEGVAGRAAQSGEIIHVTDYPGWEGRATQFLDSPFSAILAVPLLQDGRVLGVIDLVRSAAQRPFSVREIDVVNMLASQAVVAITNVRLYDATQHYAARMSALARASQALDSHGNIGTTLRPLAEAGMQALGADGCVVFAADPARIMCVIGIEDGLAGELHHELASGGLHAALWPQPMDSRGRDPGFASHVTIPFGGESAAGSISFLFREAPPWFHDDAEVAQVLAHQIAALVTNARLYQTVRESDRLKTEFVSTVSHELRTPMGAIIGYAELLLNGLYGPLDTAIHEPVSRIKSNADRLLEMINQMLDLSRTEAGRLQLHVAPFQPRDLISAIAVGIEAETTAKGLSLVVDVAPDVPAIAVGDVGRIRQVVMCLLSNALKFTPRGTITLRCRLEDTSSPQLVLDVIDTGIGIEPAHLPLIWEAFRQLDGSSVRAFQGSGLGLALVQQLTRLMGGTAGVASEPGRGSAFTIRLPLAIP